MIELEKPALACKQVDGVTFHTDDALFEACGVRIAFTARAGGYSLPPYDELNLGNHVGDDLQTVAQNRAHVLEVLGGKNVPCVVPKQVHETNVVVVADEADATRAQEVASQGADAIVVCAPGVAAQLSFADCLPLILVSPSGRFAVAHAGWRGALAGIAGIALNALVEQDRLCGYAVEPRQCNAYIGPYIHEECFETGREVVESFVQRYGEGVRARSGNVSIAQAVVIDLRHAGIDVARIADVDICTVCTSDSYFSYRATDGSCGRHGALAFRVQ